jgi:hypothetical protein
MKGDDCAPGRASSRRYSRRPRRARHVSGCFASRRRRQKRLRLHSRAYINEFLRAGRRGRESKCAETERAGERASRPGEGERRTFGEPRSARNASSPPSALAPPTYSSRIPSLSCLSNSPLLYNLASALCRTQFCDGLLRSTHSFAVLRAGRRVRDEWSTISDSKTLIHTMSVEPALSLPLSTHTVHHSAVLVVCAVATVARRCRSPPPPVSFPCSYPVWPAGRAHYQWNGREAVIFVFDAIAHC